MADEEETPAPEEEDNTAAIQGVLELGAGDCVFLTTIDDVEYNLLDFPEDEGYQTGNNLIVLGELIKRTVNPCNRGIDFQVSQVLEEGP